jgi:hypothetical protein
MSSACIVTRLDDRGSIRGRDREGIFFLPFATAVSTPALGPT